MFCTRFVSTRFVSRAKKLVSWALVSSAGAENSFRETRFVSRGKELVSWAISRVSWAKVLTRLLTKLVSTESFKNRIFVQKSLHSWVSSHIWTWIWTQSPGRELKALKPNSWISIAGLILSCLLFLKGEFLKLSKGYIARLAIITLNYWLQQPLLKTFGLILRVVVVVGGWVGAWVALTFKIF